MNGAESVAEGIVSSGKVEEFEDFLEENGIVYNLYPCEVDGKKSIYCRFNNQNVDFFQDCLYKNTFTCTVLLLVYQNEGSFLCVH